MNISAQIIVNEKLIPFENNQGKWGYLDADSDKIVISAKYDFAGFFRNGIAEVKNVNLKRKYGQEDEMLIGYIRENGEEVLPITIIGIYDVKDTRDQYNIFENIKEVSLNNDTEGILKFPEHKWIIEPGKYEEFEFYKPNQFLAGKTDFYDGDKIYTAPKGCKIDRIDFKNHFFYISKGKTTRNEGISNWEGEILVKPKYVRVKYYEQTKTFLASTFSGTLTLQNLEHKDVLNYLLDENGKQIVSFKSEQFPFIRENSTVAQYDYFEKRLFIDLKTGQPSTKEKLQIKSNEILFKDEKSGLKGVKDSTGKIMIQPIYKSLVRYGDLDFIVANKNGVEGIIDGKEKQIMPFLFQDLTSLLGDGKYIGKKDGKYCELNFKWEEDIGWKSKDSFYLELGFAKFSTVSGQGVIDKQGNTIIPSEYEKISGFEVNSVTKDTNVNSSKTLFFLAEKGMKWGLFNNLGKLIVPFERERLSKSRNQKYWVNGWIDAEDLETHKKGLINFKTGNIISPVYDEIKIFDTFLIAQKYVEKKYFYQLLHLDGKPISEVIYDRMEFDGGYLIVVKDRKRGVMNAEGKIIVPLQFNDVWVATPNLIGILENENKYFMNLKSGKEYRIKE